MYHIMTNTLHKYQNAQAGVFLEIVSVLTELYAGFEVRVYNLVNEELIDWTFHATKDEAEEYAANAI